MFDTNERYGNSHINQHPTIYENREKIIKIKSPIQKQQNVACVSHKYNESTEKYIQSLYRRCDSFTFLYIITAPIYYMKCNISAAAHVLNKVHHTTHIPWICYYAPRYMRRILIKRGRDVFPCLGLIYTQTFSNNKPFTHTLRTILFVNVYVIQGKWAQNGLTENETKKA